MSQNQNIYNFNIIIALQERLAMYGIYTGTRSIHKLSEYVGCALGKFYVSHEELVEFARSNHIPERTKVPSAKERIEADGVFANFNKLKAYLKTKDGQDRWRRLRYSVLRKYGNLCACCGRGPSNGVKLHVDHIKPKSHYPALAFELSNLQILCEDCNLGKHNSDSISWK